VHPGVADHAQARLGQTYDAEYVALAPYGLAPPHPGRPTAQGALGRDHRRSLGSVWNDPLMLGPADMLSIPASPALGTVRFNTSDNASYVTMQQVERGMGDDASVRLPDAWQQVRPWPPRSAGAPAHEFGVRTEEDECPLAAGRRGA
jgi:hypothetical protein